MIIEQNEREYLTELQQVYETEMKPLLDKGYSFTKAIRTMKVGSGKHSRKYHELKKLAVADGYQMRR